MVDWPQMQTRNGSGPVVFTGSIMHESNSFNPDPTTLADFSFREGDWSKGNTEVAGFMEEGARRGFRFVQSLYASATPKGAVDPEAFEHLTGRLIGDLKAAGKIDGVLLALHGAMFTEKYPHADEEIVRRVRAAIGPELPFVLTHDFHANVPPGIVEMTTALVIYQQTPHIDTKQRGIRAASILARTIAGEVLPKQAIVKPPMVWNLAYQNTFAEPLLPVTQASIDLEGEPGILSASVAGAYQYNDVHWFGPSVVVVADGDAARAQREAQRLSDMLWDRRELTRLRVPDAATAVRDAMASDRFPVALFEAADNVGGGAPGDETSVLAELLGQGARGWVMVVWDGEAVAAAKAAGIAGAFDMAVGGKSAAAMSAPVRVRGKVRSLHAGQYVETAVRHGGERYWDMGHSAVIEAVGSTPDELNLLVVTSLRSSPNSLNQLISCGIYPERQKILVAKGTIAPRAAYEPVAARLVILDSPGVTSLDPSRFQFQRVRPGIWGIHATA